MRHSAPAEHTREEEMLHLCKQIEGTEVMQVEIPWQCDEYLMNICQLQDKSHPRDTQHRLSMKGRSCL